MYSIDSMYESMIDGVVAAVKEKRAERWVAMSCFWLGRQQIRNQKDFWYAVAAKITTLLPENDQTAIHEQLRKDEDLLFAAVDDWPEVPAQIEDLLNSWSPTPTESDIETVRANAVLKVDRAAEAYRMQFITPGYGQIMTYQQKLEEARAKVANSSIADSSIPHIVAEAEATGKSKMDVANDVVATFEQWQTLSAGIEGKRMSAKKAIAEAKTIKIIAAAADVDWAE